MRKMKEILEAAQQHNEYWVEAVMLEFTEVICELMEKQNISRSEVARKLGVSPAYITKILRGNANMTIRTMVALANIFNHKIEINVCDKKSYSAKMYEKAFTFKMWGNKTPKAKDYNHKDYKRVSLTNLAQETEHEAKSVAA